MPSNLKLDNVTTCGHNAVMKKVRIAEFKSRLSAHLRAVENGAEIIVLDRERPIARVSPFAEGADDFLVRPPRMTSGLKGLRYAPLGSGEDVVDLLRADRNQR